MLALLLNSTETDLSKYIINSWNDKVAPYHTSIDVLASDVYSISAGQVLFIGNKEGGTQFVTVKVNNTQVIIYSNLVSVDVKLGMKIQESDKIGTADTHVQVEYCTSTQYESKWPYRVYEFTYFKQNPSGLVTGQTVLTNYRNSTYNNTQDYMYPYLDDEQSAEYGSSKGLVNGEF